MPYVNVPNDLSKVKTKMALNLTKRQLICFGCAAAVGIPSYLLARGSIGNTGAMFLMLAVMLPAFLLAMYEKDGLPAEKVPLPVEGWRIPQGSPSSLWEGVSKFHYPPRCHRARCCHALGQRLRRSLGQPPVPKGGRSVVMAARLLSLGFSAARGLC